MDQSITSGCQRLTLVPQGPLQNSTDVTHLLLATSLLVSWMNLCSESMRISLNRPHHLHPSTPSLVGSSSPQRGGNVRTRYQDVTKAAVICYQQLPRITYSAVTNILPMGYQDVTRHCNYQTITMQSS